jgi:hypothetical protein
VSRVQKHYSNENLSERHDSNVLPTVTTAFGARSGGSRITALHIEFVAKPNEAHRVQSALPETIHSALEEVAGFAGSFVMISNYEARLVTVVTLWAGENRSQRCSENERWVRALLAPYLDRCLRVQTLAAYLPISRTAAPSFESPESDRELGAFENHAEVTCVA